MSLISRQELYRELKQGQVRPLYLLFGPEDYLRDRAARTIADAGLREAPLRELNDASFSLATTDVQQAIASAEQLPMMAPRRVIRITDFSKLREADEDALARYVARPVESSVVIFIADELDKRRKLSKTLLGVCASVEFARFTDDELVGWARSRSRELKVEADEPTLRHLVALVGNDVRTLSSELDKLATAALDAGRITVETIDALVGRSRELSNFELTDHLLERNRPRALQTLHRLLDDGVEPVMLIGLIASNYRRMALAKALVSRQAPNEEVFRVVNMPYHRRKDFLASARRTDARVLTRGLERIAAADVAIKTSQATPRLQLELLVCELSAHET